ncbi:MAG: GIY-YIG nuclease family protein [Alphaproteobacteria bacterium]|nr:GIY-YIG nuclease family protein [Alphaproteobacteria bacterium]
MDKDALLKLIADDDLGLLQVKPKPTGAITADERLITSFEEINQFIKGNGREPTAGNGVQEHRLYARLKGFRESKEKIEALKPYDVSGLLPDHVKEIKTISDIFDDDDLGILNDDAESIFTLKNVPKETTMPDYVAQRKPCNDFAEYEDRFKQCQADLAAGKRQVRPFANEQQIEAGYFFVLKGILLYVAEVGEREMVDGKRNARLRCIFENGTESDMLLRSLSAELYKNGRRVTEHGDRLLAGFDNITDEDQESGYIYVLRSLSQKPEIQSIQNLYKIGFSRVPVEERIKNATEEPTYLMAPVKIVTAYQCYNMNPQKLELLLHTFFGSSCLNIDVFDGAGQRHTPREWFIAPLEVIEQAIHFLLNGEIVNYRYDPERQEIVGR